MDFILHMKEGLSEVEATGKVANVEAVDKKMSRVKILLHQLDKKKWALFLEQLKNKQNHIDELLTAMKGQKMISLEAKVKELFEGHYCLIVEPSASFSSCIMGVLKSLGITPEQMIVAHKYEAAEALIAEKKPKLLITEYEMNEKLGLSLIEKQSEFFDSMSRISIIVTSNTNDSAVAEAAEEEVDAFIVKPFSGQSFTDKITKVLLAKLEPSQYIQTIEVGKGHYFSKEFVEAANKFSAAKSLDPKPTLACFYLGQTF